MVMTSKQYLLDTNILIDILNSIPKVMENMEAAVQSKPFTPFQIEMLEMVSRVSSEAEMRDIRSMLGQYFAKRAEDALDRLWDEGVINEGVIEEWKHEHMRTPYKQ